jgi:hypothetical protein
VSQDLGKAQEQQRGVEADADKVSWMLKSAITYIRSRFITIESHGGWRQFLQEDGTPSVTGTACAISSLTRIGVRPSDDQLRAGANLIVAHLRQDGGWSKPELDDYASITLITCLALNALNALGMGPLHASVEAGLQWLVNAQNRDGGWGGIARDDQSNVTATAYCLRVLTTRENFGGYASTSIERGVDWLIKQGGNAGGWGITANSPPTLAHTSHAVEGLTAAGYAKSDLARARDWLLAELKTTPLTPWVEHYNFSGQHARALPRQLRSSRLSWTHLPAERVLIALLKLGVDPTSDALSNLVRDIFARRLEIGYWQVPTVPSTAPAWAVLEAVNALSLLMEGFDRVRDVVAFRETTRILATRVSNLEASSSVILDQLAGLARRLDDMDKARARLTLTVKHVKAVLRVVTSAAGRVVATLAGTAAIVVLYSLNWSKGDGAGTKAVGIATIVAPGIAILALIGLKRGRH